MISPRSFRRNRKGIGTVFGMVFFLLITMIVFASFVVILNQNTNLEQTVIQTRQIDNDKSTEQLIINLQQSVSLYSNFGSNTLNVSCVLTNPGTLPVTLKRLWVQDDTTNTASSLAVSVVLKQGNVTQFSREITFPGEIQATDNFRFWFVTARGNQFTLQQGYGDTFDITNEVMEITASIVGDFLPDYHSAEWGEVVQVGSNYEVSHWNRGWIIPQDEDFNMVWRVNCSYRGSTTLTLDQNTMLFFIPSMARNPGEHALNPFMCYIVSSTTTGAVSQIAPYPGHELTILPKTNVTLYFGTEAVGYGPDDDYGFSNLIFGDMDASMMSLTIYGKSPSTYAQSFPLFAVIPRLLSIRLDSYDGVVGTTVSVTGVGFTRNSIITLKYDSNTLSTSPSTITSNNQGDFSASFIVPVSTVGEHSVSATDTTSETAQVLFTVVPAIAANPQIGPRYTSIDLSGSGFAASSSIVITFEDNSISTQPITDSTGSFQATFDVPGLAVIGTNSIEATDGHGNSASTTFLVVLPAISLNPGGGPVGTSVTISGLNFVPDSEITVTFSGNTVASTTATSTGTIPMGVSFVVPSVSVGTYNVQATDLHGNSATVPFTVNQFQNLISNPSFENSGNWVTASSGTGSSTIVQDSPWKYSGAYSGKTQTTGAGDGYSRLSQTLTSTSISSVANFVGSLSCYMHLGDIGEEGTYTVELRIKTTNGNTLSYYWGDSSAPSDSPTTKYYYMGRVADLGASDYYSFSVNLYQDWLAKWSTGGSMDINQIQLVSNGDRAGQTNRGQSINWDDLQLMYSP